MFRDPFGVPKFIFAALATVVSLSASLRSRGFAGFVSALDLPVFAFGAAALLSAGVSTDPWLSWTGPDFEPLPALPGLALCAAGFFAARAATNRGTFDRLARWTASGAALVAALAVAERFGWRTTPFERGDAARAISTFGSPTALAAYLAFALPFAVREALSAPRRRRLLGAAAFVLTVTALGLTRSRGAWVAAAAGLALSYWLRLPRSKAEVRRAVVAALCVLTVGAFAARWGWGGRTGDWDRLMAWKIAVEQFRETPWLGSGPGTFTLAFRGRSSEAMAALSRGTLSFPHAHNDWLEVAASFGTAGLAAFFWLHWRAGKRLAVLLRESSVETRKDLAVFCGAAAALLTVWKFNFPGIPAAWLAGVWGGVVFVPEASATRSSRAAGPLAISAGLFALGFGLWDASADRLDVLGRKMRLRGEPRRAAEYFHRALALNPGKTAYRLDLLNTLWDSAGDRVEALDAAIELASDGVRRRPAEAETHRMLGLALMRRGRLVRARAALEASVALAPGMRFGLHDLAETAKLQGDAARVRELQERLERIEGRSSYSPHEDRHNGAWAPLGRSAIISTQDDGHNGAWAPLGRSAIISTQDDGHNGAWAPLGGS